MSKIIRFEHGVTVSADALGVVEIQEHTDETGGRWRTEYRVVGHSYVGDFTYKTCITHADATAAKLMLDTLWGLEPEGPSDADLVAFMDESGAATAPITNCSCGNCGSGLSDLDGLGWKHTEPFGSDKRGMCVSARPTFTQPTKSIPVTGGGCTDGSCLH